MTSQFRHRPAGRLPALVLLVPSVALVALVPMVLPPAAAAQVAALSATVQEILDGPDLFIDRQRARVKDVAREPQDVSTRDTRAQLLFSSGAGGRMPRRSLLRLGSDCLRLEQGQLLISGRQGGCTRSLRLSVRGTNYVLEVFENGDTAVTSLEGRLEVELLRDGEPSGLAPRLLTSGQRLRWFAGPGLVTQIALTAEDYRAILRGPLFEGFRSPLPEQAALEAHLQSNVPGVELPQPQARERRGRPGFSFGFGFGLGGSGNGGGGSGGGQERELRPAR
jgi:hypothetical protein